MKDDLSRRGRTHDESLARALGRTIKVLRTDRGLGRKDLARRAGISYSYLTEIENGTKPASNTILGPIADTLGLQLYELIAAAESRAQAGESPALDPTDSLRLGSGSLPRMSSRPLSPDYAPDFKLDVARGQRIAPPSARRTLALRAQPPAPAETTGPNDADSLSTREILGELSELLQHMSRDDRLRLLDMARRLAR